MAEPSYIDQGATFDADRRYRYRLWRVWDASLPRVAFVMLNPSTADETKLDPTLRRCLGFARAFGCGSFEIANLFALRSTSPTALYHDADPVGPENDAALLDVAARAGYGVIAGWGAHGELNRRGTIVASLLTSAGHDLLCLARTMAGGPKHPLYLRSDAVPEVWRAGARAPSEHGGGDAKEESK